MQLDLHTKTFFAIKQNKKEDHCHQRLSAKCKLILPTGQKQSISISGGEIPREGSQLCWWWIFWWGFFLFVFFLSPPRSDILKQSRFLITERHCNWRQPNPFSWDTVPMKPHHRFQKNNLFGKVWRNTLLVNNKIYLNCIPLMTLTSHFNKQSKHLIYIYQLRRISLVKFLQRKLCYQAGGKN